MEHLAFFKNYLAMFVAYNRIHGIIGLTLPIVGWLMNIFIRWYKVVQWSIWIMWITSMLATLNSIIAKVAIDHDSFSRGISLAMTSMMTIGFGGYQANSIRFGLDQLQDASTTEITAFITWYVWTYCSNTSYYHELSSYVTKRIA